MGNQLWQMQSPQGKGFISMQSPREEGFILMKLPPRSVTTRAALHLDCSASVGN
jgi:hypothetical protein